jgi:uncharacterized repeat protein (TIGR01451 family)
MKDFLSEGTFDSHSDTEDISALEPFLDIQDNLLSRYPEEESTPAPEGGPLSSETLTSSSTDKTSQTEAVLPDAASMGDRAEHYVYIPLFMNNTGNPPVYGADLSIQKLRDPNDSIAPGDVITYTLSYSNNSDKTATGVNITDTLPDYTTYISGGDWQSINGTQYYQLELGELAPYKSGETSITIQVDEDIPESTTSITNSARISYDSSQGTDPNWGDNTSSLETAIVQSLLTDITITEITTSPDLVEPGDLLTYQVTVANQGESSAKDITLNIAAPENTIFDQEHSSPEWVLNEGSGCYEVMIDDLDSGATHTSPSIAFLVDDPVPAGEENIEGTFTVFYIADTDNINDSLIESTSLTAAPDLMVSVSSDNIYIQPGDTIV